MNVLNKTETDAAHRLIQGGSRPEDQVRQDIVRVLDGLAIESLLTYPTEAGPADIYLPRRRVFIEVKAAGLATYPLQTHGRGNQETPFEQVKRYLLAEMDEELGRLFPSEQNDMPWTGIVTDGRVWHAWRFPHKPNTEEKYILGGFIPQNEDELLRRVIPIIESETVGKLWIPPDPLDLFKSYLGGLQEIYKDISNSNSRVRKATETKKHLWLDILRGSGMAPEREYAQDDLFIAHCFLVALSRGVVHTLITDDDPDPNRLFRDGYLAWTIEVESGRKWAQRLLDRIHSYDWRRTKGDVLRPLYEGLVSARDRRDFGEVYTPDWLAEMMVKDVLDDEWCNQAVSTALAVSHGESMPGGIGVLDPTCGSGTFLYHCAKRILASKNAKTLPPVQRSDVVCRLVSGIDIHPVAVEFARATLLRALPAPPSMDLAGLAIYQGDCLMLRQTDKRSLFAPTDGEVLITSPLGREIRIPREFSDHPGFPDMLGRLVEAALHGDPVPEDIRKIMKNVERQIFMCHAALAEIIEEEGNSVWTWYIKNVLGPDRLARRKVNRIVANPPWVKMANIQEPRRKRQLERVAGKDGTEYARLWVGGPQAPHFDIAQLFIYHARSIYLDRPQTDPAAWVAKASAIRGGNWKKFRKLHEKHCAQFLDFSSVKVFGGGDARRSCVIFEVRRSSVGEDVEIKAKYKNETLLPSMSWREVSRFLDWTKPECFEKKRSEYTPEQWRQGATITPKVLTVVDKKWGGHFGTWNVTTAKSDKAKWKTVSPRSGEVPVEWLSQILVSGRVLPFMISGFRTAIIPCGKDGTLARLPEKAGETDFWRELDDLYQEHRGLGGNTPKSLLSRMNYGNALAKQLPLISQTGWLVVYPSCGDIMRASCIQAGAAVIDSSVYRRSMNSHAEARYLVAVLNAPSLEKAFRLGRTSGRCFSKSPWESVPIPAWDEINNIHQELSLLSEIAEESVKEMDLPPGQVAASKRIREKLSAEGTFGEIDALVKKILPKHVSH